MRSKSVVKNQDVAAATFVVGKDLSECDFLDIQTAINNLPPEGGTIFIREGTYSISSSIVLPNKPVRIKGAGNATVLSIGSNAISVFTSNYGKRYVFEDFAAAGDSSTSGQNLIELVDGVLHISRVNIPSSNTLKVGIKQGSSGSGYVFIRDCEWYMGTAAFDCDYDVWLHADHLECEGGIIGGAQVTAYDCWFAFLDNGLINESQFYNCALTFGSGKYLEYQTGYNAFPCVFDKCTFGLHMGGSVDRYIDATSGDYGELIVTGCRFYPTINNEAIRLACSNSHIEGNLNCKVTETGTPTGNLYANNDGISGSTLLGSNSRIGPENYRNVMDFGAKGDGTTNDQPAIAAAIAALPVAGGTIFFPPGRYRVNSTLAVPAKNIVFKGSGRSTILDIASNGIDLFTISQYQTLVFEDMEIWGDGSTANQNFIKVTAGAYAWVYINRVDIDLENFGSNALQNGVVRTDGTIFVYVTDSTWNCLEAIADGYGENLYVYLDHVRMDEYSGFLNNPAVYARDCEFSLWQVSIGESEFNRCSFFLADSSEIDCTPVMFADKYHFRFEDCVFTHGGSPDRAIDILGNKRVFIRGCVFDGMYNNEAVRLSTIAGGVIADNYGCKVTEIGSTNNFYYSNNRGFDGSTIIGANSRVDGSKRKAVSGGNTTDAYVAVFEHINQKGIVGVGTIKNTHGSNSLTVRETVTDFFGTTDSLETPVAAGNDFLLEAQVNIDTARPPYKSYKVEVKSTAAGNAATYDLQYVSQGAE